jgi:hypothetical protein
MAVIMEAIIGKITSDPMHLSKEYLVGLLK